MNPSVFLPPKIIASQLCSFALLYFTSGTHRLHKIIRNSEKRRSGEPEKRVWVRTFSRSGSLRASASSLLSITEAAATSSGVEPRIDGDAAEDTRELHYTMYIYTHTDTSLYSAHLHTQQVSFSVSRAGIL